MAHPRFVSARKVSGWEALRASPKEGVREHLLTREGQSRGARVQAHGFQKVFLVKSMIAA